MGLATQTGRSKYPCMPLIWRQRSPVLRNPREVILLGVHVTRVNSYITSPMLQNPCEITSLGLDVTGIKNATTVT